MSVLIDGPPVELEVDGQLYPIDADFRNCISILEMYKNSALNKYEQQDLMVRLLFDELPDDFTKAAQVAVDFLNLGNRNLKVVHKKPIYSFSHDDKFIRTAMRSKFQIDFDNLEFFHFWDFMYSFFELRDTHYNEVMGVRARIQDGTATKHDRKYARDNPELINIDFGQRNQTEDDEFMARYKAAKARQGR